MAYFVVSDFLLSLKYEYGTLSALASLTSYAFAGDLFSVKNSGGRKHARG